MEFVLKKPTLTEIDAMLALVEKEVKQGVILYRSAEEIATAIRSYYVAKDSNHHLIGFCALHLYSQNLAEVRSLIVHQDYRGKGVGKALVQEVLKEGQTLGVREVLVLTYKQAFFESLGFKVIDKSLLPNHKIWADCIKCKRFPVCDEIALIKQF